MSRLPKPTLLLRPEGSYNRNGPVIPTRRGAVRSIRGKHGQAWRIEEGTTNLIRNPALNVDLSNVHASTQANLTREVSQFVDPVFGFGWNAAKYVAGVSGWETIEWLSVDMSADGGGTAPRSFSASNWVKFPTGYQFLMVARIYVNGWSAARDGMTAYTGTGEWQYVTSTVTSVSGDTINEVRALPAARWSNQGGPGNITYWATCAQTEEKPYATTIATGAMGSGFRWNGTANASSTTRDPGVVQLPDSGHADSTRGSALVRLRKFNHNGVPSQWAMAFGTWADNSKIDFLGFNVEGRNPWVQSYDGSTYSSVSHRYVGPGQQLGLNEHEIVYIEWDGNRMGIQTAGGPLVSGARSVPAGRFGHTINLGSWHQGQSANIDVESVLFYEHPLAEEERGELFAMDRAWTWVELAEPARITNIVQRGTGAYAVQTTLWRADKYGNRIERIPVDMPVQGSITFNEDTLEKHILSLEINNPHQLTPFEDYLIPELTLTDAAGNRETRPKGHYVVTPPNTTLTAARFSGTVEARSVLWRLAVESLPDGMVIPPGVDFGAAARDIALGMDLQPQQLALPLTGVLTKDRVDLTPGIKRLTAINQLYNTASYYTVWADDFGIITTMPYRELQLAQPIRHYSTRSDEPVTIVPPVSGTPEWNRLRNRITVRNIAPDREPIYATLDVQDRTSPVHRDNLGFVLAGEPIDDPDIPDETAALKRCEVELANGASYYRKLTIRTLLDLEAGAHDVVGLDVERHGAHYDGSWIRRMWAIQLRGVTALTTAEVYRIERWR